MDRNRFSRQKSNAWAEWLADDGLSSDPPRVHHVRQPTGTDQSAQEAVAGPVPTVSIQIAVPKFRLPKLPYKRIGIGLAVALVAGGLVVGGLMLGKQFLDKRKAEVKGTATEASLSFTPVAPEGKPELAQGANPDNTAYDPQRRLYSFTDHLMGFGVTVSQQQVPDSFKKDANNLKKAAESMGGKLVSIETAFGTAYISTSTKGEAQRVVFIYQDRLVFLASYKNFDNETWKYYIETLR